MKNIIYCRVSHQKVENLSFSKQEKHCSNYSKSKNFIIHEIHKEFNSGYGKQKILLNIIKTYKNINLIIYDVSRFSRSTNYGRSLFKICMIRNIVLHFVKENIVINSDNCENLTFSKSLIESEKEWHGIRNSIINNIQQRRLNNMVLGKVPFGFDSIDKKLVKNKDFNSIALIVFLRNGLKSVDDIRNILKNFTNEANTLKFYDENEKEITNFSKPFALDTAKIKDILNDYRVCGIRWTTDKVRNLYKRYSNTIDFASDTKKAISIRDSRVNTLYNELFSRSFTTQRNQYTTQRDKTMENDMNDEDSDDNVI